MAINRLSRRQLAYHIKFRSMQPTNIWLENVTHSTLRFWYNRPSAFIKMMLYTPTNLYNQIRTCSNTTQSHAPTHKFSARSRAPHRVPPFSLSNTDFNKSHIAFFNDFCFKSLWVEWRHKRRSCWRAYLGEISRTLYTN